MAPIPPVPFYQHSLFFVARGSEGESEGERGRESVAHSAGHKRARGLPGQWHAAQEIAARLRRASELDEADEAAGEDAILLGRTQASVPAGHCQVLPIAPTAK